MNGGWIKLHRKFTEWEWYSDMVTSRLFIHMLLTANHADKKWLGIVIKRGQFVSSLSKLSSGAGLSVMQIRNSLNKLKVTGEVTSESCSKYTMFTVLKYDFYQSDNTQDNKPTTREVANEQQTDSNKQECKEGSIPSGVNKIVPPLKDAPGNDATVLHWWNWIAQKYNLPAVEDITQTRSVRFFQRKQEGFWDSRERIEFAIRDSAVLRGTAKNSWQVTFDWLIQDDTNWRKVVEGNYAGTECSPVKRHKKELEPKPFEPSKIKFQSKEWFLYHKDKVPVHLQDEWGVDEDMNPRSKK